MSLRSFEAEMLQEARRVTGKNRLRQKDIMEWSTGAVEQVDGEVHYYLPDLKIHIAVKAEEVK